MFYFSPPTIKLENSKGLSNTLVNELLKELTEKAADLKGEEMIFQLCQHVEEFLHRYNKPTSESFYDEMLKRQKEKEEMVLLEENRQVDIDLNVNKILCHNKYYFLATVYD